MQSDKSIAILSPNDAEILIRLHDDLVKRGLKENYKKWNDIHSPLNNTHSEWAKAKGRSVWYFSLEICRDGEIVYANNNSTADININLTPDNYAQTLETILSNFNIKINA